MVAGDGAPRFLSAKAKASYDHRPDPGWVRRSPVPPAAPTRRRASSKPSEIRSRPNEDAPPPGAPRSSPRRPGACERSSDGTRANNYFPMANWRQSGQGFLGWLVGKEFRQDIQPGEGPGGGIELFGFVSGRIQIRKGRRANEKTPGGRLRKKLVVVGHGETGGGKSTRQTRFP